MKKLFISLIVALSLSAYAADEDNSNKEESREIKYPIYGTQPTPAPQAESELDVVIQQNFKEIDALIVKVDEKIKRVDALRKVTDAMFANKDNLILCSIVDELESDIKTLTQKIAEMNGKGDVSEQQKILDAHKRLYTEQKDSIQNQGISCGK